VRRGERRGWEGWAGEVHPWKSGMGRAKRWFYPDFCC